MIGLRIGAAELAEIEAGAPAVVLAPGRLLPHAPPLVPLALKDGVLARPGAGAAPHVPLPVAVKLLAVIGTEREAEPMLPLLPPGIPVLPDAAALLGGLAGALKAATLAVAPLAAERDALKRALGTLAPPRPRLVMDLAPAEARVPPSISQPLGRPAEGLSAIALHVAQGSAVGLKVGLLAAGRVVACWRVPADALQPGWLTLDLPEPMPPGPAEAVLEIQAEPGRGEPAQLSAISIRPGSSLALRAWVAGPGWSVLPRHFDWAACDAPRPILPLALPAALLAAAVVEGATAELVAAGEQEPTLLLDLPAGGEATIRLPATPVGPADLLRARISLRGRPARPLPASFTVVTGPETSVATGWRSTDAGGYLAVNLPLPPGPMAELTAVLRNPNATAVVVEVTGLALQAGAAGERRAAPPVTEGMALGGPRALVAMPVAAAPPPLPPVLQAGPGLEVVGWRQAPPAPRPAVAAPGGGAPPPVPAAAPAAPAPAAVSLPSGTAFQDFKVSQHLVNKDGSYRHLDVTMTGLVAGGGLWRQVRLKLFDRRGTIGLEFREMAGWPQMFDTWPGAQRDNYGPFWRLETDTVEEGLDRLSSAHDRALIAALLEVLPDLASRAAAASGLGAEDASAWAGRARDLAAAVAEVRGG